MLFRTKIERLGNFNFMNDENNHVHPSSPSFVQTSTVECRSALRRRRRCPPGRDLSTLCEEKRQQLDSFRCRCHPVNRREKLLSKQPAARINWRDPFWFRRRYALEHTSARHYLRTTTGGYSQQLRAGTMFLHAATY